MIRQLIFVTLGELHYFSEGLAKNCNDMFDYVAYKILFPFFRTWYKHI